MLFRLSSLLVIASSLLSRAALAQDAPAAGEGATPPPSDGVVPPPQDVAPPEEAPVVTAGPKEAEATPPVIAPDATSPSADGQRPSDGTYGFGSRYTFANADSFGLTARVATRRGSLFEFGVGGGLSAISPENGDSLTLWHVGATIGPSALIARRGRFDVYSFAALNVVFAKLEPPAMSTEASSLAFSIGGGISASAWLTDNVALSLAVQAASLAVAINSSSDGTTDSSSNVIGVNTTPQAAIALHYFFPDGSGEARTKKSSSVNYVPSENPTMTEDEYQKCIAARKEIAAQAKSVPLRERAALLKTMPECRRPSGTPR